MLEVPSRATPLPQLRGTGAGWSSADWILALAVAALLFAPASYGLSVLLAPAAWALAARDVRRCGARGVAPTQRVEWARTLARRTTYAIALVAALAAILSAVFASIFLPVAVGVGLAAVVLGTAAAIAYVASGAPARRRLLRRQAGRSQRRAARRP